MVLDMLLAEKGGVCKMIPETSTCCTYIPDNTGPNGKVTLAIQKLEDLSKELKQNSGLTNPWDQYFTWIKGGWQGLLTQIGIAILVMAAIICCVLPCIRKFVEKAVDQTTPTFMNQEISDDDDDVYVRLDENYDDNYVLHSITVTLPRDATP